METVLELSHPSTYICDTFEYGLKHLDESDCIQMWLTREELEYLVEVLKGAINNGQS